MSKLWSKGYDLNKQIESFTVGNDPVLDLELIPYDCLASKAHANMLEKIGVLSADESQKLKQELDNIIALHAQGKFGISIEQEDCHTAIEAHLTSKLGDMGQKIHTARSRNDQVLTALRLYYKAQLQDIRSLQQSLMATMNDFIAEYGDIQYPGYTHMQAAMPSSFALWGASFIDSLQDNEILLSSVLQLIDQSPLGTGAGYGIPMEIDRELTAKEMGFSKVQNNPIYTQHSRGKFESSMLHVLAQITADLNKIASDLILFSMKEFGFVELPLELCTGSSIMPQKKNPDVLELLRAKHHVVSSLGFQVSGIGNNLISGYNRDAQLTKEPVMSALKTTSECLQIGMLLMSKLKVNGEACEAAMSPELFATAKVYELVAQGIPFRQAYQQIAKGLTQFS